MKMVRVLEKTALWPTARVPSLESSRMGGFVGKGKTLVLFVSEDTGILAAACPAELRDVAEKELKWAREEQFKGKVGEVYLARPQTTVIGRILFAGVGKEKEFATDRLRRAAGAAAKRARDIDALHIYVALPAATEKDGCDALSLCRAVAEGLGLGVYRFDGHKRTEDKAGRLERCTILHGFDLPPAQVADAIRRGRIYAEAVTLTRDLTNEPANFMTPTTLAEVARRVARQFGLGFKTFSRSQIERMGMGGLLGVSRGSAQPPTFSVLTYRPSRAKVTRTEKKAAGKPLYKKVSIIGKGLTFDSGGLSLKPADGMQHMKNDMAGAAAVVAAMGAIAQLKPDVEVLGIVPATENLPSGTATKPGDVLKSFSGKTIEVTNTDAEGRLILADAVAYAEKQGAEAIVDAATLTGAASVALGPAVSALMGTDQHLIDEIKKAAEAEGEKVWQLPLVEEYKEMLKSESADIRNTDLKPAAGTIKGGLFISAFVDRAKWAHLDIAATAYTDKEHHLGPVGATGVITRTLIEWVTQHT